jgi:hypothetical protein
MRIATVAAEHGYRPHEFGDSVLIERQTRLRRAPNSPASEAAEVA